MTFKKVYSSEALGLFQPKLVQSILRFDVFVYKNGNTDIDPVYHVRGR